MKHNKPNYKLITCNCQHGKQGTEHCAVMYPSKKFRCGVNCLAYKEPKPCKK